MFKMYVHLVFMLHVSAAQGWPSSGNTSFKGVYCTVHFVKWYLLRHIIFIITNFDDVGCFLLIFCIAAI
jgi:hypothetical protein